MVRRKTFNHLMNRGTDVILRLLQLMMCYQNRNYQPMGYYIKKHNVKATIW